MKKFLPISIIVLSTLLQHSYAANLEESGDKKIEQSEFTKFIKAGKPIFNIRYLHESVNQKGIANQANANTVRTRVGYETAKFYDVSGLIEFENIKRIGAENYNDTTNNRTNYPTVSDPNDTNLNRLHVDYSGIKETNIRLGRQTISLGNQRFVGGIAWRQNDQTMDAISVNTKLIKNSEIFYAHANRVNRVFGTRSKVGTWNDNNIDLVNASYSFMPFLKATGYSYLLDIPDNPALSSATYGSKLDAKHKFNDQFTSALVSEYAYQRGYAGNPKDAVFNYFMVEPSLTYGQWTVRGQYESIGGNGTTAMQFALGTNHAFNGWVDKFLTTPANGLIDSNIALEYVFKSDLNWINGAKTFIRYHKFRAENTNRIMDYGSEIDFFFEKSFKNNFTIGVQSGKYKAKGLYTNTIKVMPYVSFKL